jgi:hypothetical protein
MPFQIVTASLIEHLFSFIDNVYGHSQTCYQNSTFERFPDYFSRVESFNYTHLSIFPKYLIFQ